MARVSLRRVRKSYGSVVALDDLELEIEDGEFISVLGPSGSGKSTMLKLIAGIEEVSSGQILFDGQDVTQTPPERRDIAMVFQSYALYPTMSVFDNIAFPLRLRRVPKAEIRKQVERAAELLGIGGLLGRRPRALSGGERQRVAIGRAIVRDPQVFLFDEPLSNLDAHLRAGMRQELKHLHRVLGTTFIYVTHDQDDALDLGDRIAVLADGRLQQFAASSEIYEAPANRFVASFVGHPPMNLVTGRLEYDDGEVVFHAHALRLPLGGAVMRDLPETVVLGVRPEALTVRPAGEGSSQAVVESIAVLGYQRLYAAVRLGDTTFMTRVPEATVPPSIGETVELQVDPAGVHFFDLESGVRLGGRPVPVAGRPTVTR